MKMESDEEYGAALLRTLDRDPGGPPAVDVNRAIAAGKRQRLRVTLAGSAAAVVAAGLVVGVTVAIADRDRPAATPVAAAPTGTTGVAAGAQAGVPAPTGCALAPLPIPAGQGRMSVVNGADPSGRYIVGRSYPTAGDNHPLLIWDDGQVRTVTMSGTDQEFNDINTAGEAVGTSYGNSGPMAWAYRAGTLTRLAGANATAGGIDEQGVIAGSVDDKPATWRSASAQPAMLPMPASGRTGAVTGIDEDGTMVGWVAGAPGQPQVGYEWLPDGTGKELTVPTPNGKPIAEFSAYSIRNGWVVGAGGDPTNSGSASYTIRWNLHTGAVDVTPNPQNGLVGTINAQGWIVGDSGTHAQLVAGGKQIALPDLDVTRQSMNVAFTISDDGATLAGQVESSGGQPIAVEWHCH
jgi:hypothetical protein